MLHPYLIDEFETQKMKNSLKKLKKNWRSIFRQLKNCKLLNPPIIEGIKLYMCNLLSDQSNNFNS